MRRDASPTTAHTCADPSQATAPAAAAVLLFAYRAARSARSA
jgi:hypothetical protein